MDFSNLNDGHIKQLEAQGCSAENWKKVFLKDTSNSYLKRLKNVEFIGNVKIGDFKENLGIKNTTIHNCEIGNNVHITRVNYLSNYIIGNNVRIENVNTISVNEKSSFGNGTLVNVINESGKRKIPIYDLLSSHIAYILAIYRHRTKAINNINKMVDSYIKSISSNIGRIGNNAKIENCNQILEVNIGEGCTISGASKLKNGSINSTHISPVFVGSGVIAENFIISSDSKVDNSTFIKNCFVGQACILDKNYSAVHSAFFANSQGFNGEACSLFAGPYTVTHHKSTLLIAGIFSFMNAGSGSNQSNHMYKLGPIHQGVVERGAKTTSDSYLFWPAKIGAFNLVMGRHYLHPDTSDFPFSYIIESNDNNSFLVPGVNLRSIGTIRDAKKFPLRDMRDKKHRLDYINFNLLSPYTIHKMINGRKILKNLLSASGELAEFFSYNGMKITKKSLIKGIQLYEKAIQKFLGNSLISRLNGVEFISEEHIHSKLKPSTTDGIGKWVDVSGLICPLQLLIGLLDDVENNKIISLNQIDKTIEKWHKNYYEYEWTWAAKALEEFYEISLSDITVKQIINIVEKWKKCVIDLDHLIYEDARKEFSLATSIGFGADGDQKEKALDFLNVRGDFESNDTIQEIKNHIIKKTKLGNKIIAQLLNIKTKQKV